MIAIDEPKLINLPAVEYFSDHSAWSQSMLKTFADRRRLAHAYYVERSATPPVPKSDRKLKMDKGTVLHTAILEPHRFDRLVVRWPDGMLSDDGGIRTTKAKAFRDEHAAAGLYVLKDEHYDAVKAMAESVKRVCGEWFALPSRREQSIYWTDESTGLPCKLRLDWLVFADTPVVFDLKSTADASPSAFRRVCENLNYGVQEAHYTDGVEQVTGKTPLFYFIAVEDTFPFACAIHQLDERSSQDSRGRHIQLLHDVRGCIDSGDWSEPWEQRVNTLSLRNFYDAA